MKFKIIHPGIFHTHPYHNINLNAIDKLIDFLSKHKFTTFLFWQPLEFIGEPLDRLDTINDNNKKIMNEILNENDLFVYFLYGGFNGDYYLNLKNIFPNRVNFLTWPTHLLHYTKYYLEKSYGKKIEDISINKNFNKLFFNLNHNPRLHRAMIIDRLSKYDLLKNNLFTWNRTDALSEDGTPYKFQFWKENIVTFDLHKIEDFDFNYNVSKLLTPNLLNTCSLFNINTETYFRNEYYFITEKTYKNILTEQPFFTFGPPNMNKKIQELGFVLYDEIIDYSYDEIESLEDRVESYVDNLNKIKDLNYNDLYKKIEDKVIFNKKRALEIIDYDLLIPKFVTKSYSENPDVFMETFNGDLFTYPFVLDVFKNNNSKHKKIFVT